MSSTCISVSHKDQVGFAPAGDYLNVFIVGQFFVEWKCMQTGYIEDILNIIFCKKLCYHLFYQRMTPE
jgi:hypothetical protein